MLWLFVLQTVAAHVPVPLEKVPPAVIEAVHQRLPGFVISEAEVSADHSALSFEGMTVLYVIKGTDNDRELAIEVTPEGLLIDIYERAYYEENIED